MSAPTIAVPGAPYEPELATATSLAMERAQLLAVASGRPVLLPKVDLVALANLPYQAPDPDLDPDMLTVATYALDMYWYRTAEERRGGGQRARGIHYNLCRYVLPFLLEHRNVTSPLTAGRWRISDFTALVQILAGERALPAATVAADRLGRLAITCHWLSLDDAALACKVDRDVISAAVHTGLPVAVTAEGEPAVSAMDLRIAGLLPDRSEPHGLSRDSADLIIQLLHMTWRRANNLGARLTGDPKGITAKHPLAKYRQREPNPTARVYVSPQRCLEVAARLHPVHQRPLFEGRFVAAREGETFGCLVEDRRNDVLHLHAVGGAPRDVRNEDGQFVRSDSRAGTKGSLEGVLPPSSRELARDLRERHVPLAPAVVAFSDAFDAVFHTDPVTGEVESWARAIPGLQAEDISGSAAFDAALKQACAETADTTAGPVYFSAHDLRASLNTDLENAGVDDRLLRHLLGHRTEDGRKLDVHDGHYDLGLDEPALQQLATAIQSLLPDGVDLCVPTQRLPQFGKGTRHANRLAYIEAELLRRGWYAPGGLSVAAGEDGGDVGVEVTTKVAAERLDVSVSQVKRLIEQGELMARKTTKGRRDVWLIPEAVVDAELARRNRVRLTDLAEELGVPYHRLWQLAQRLGHTAGHDPGAAIRLSGDEAMQLRTEVARAGDARAASMTHSEAARQLSLPEPMVQTLVRSGVLVAACGKSRIARVTRDSVETYAVQYPPSMVQPDEMVVPIGQVREVLQISRHAVTDLIRSRQLAVTSIERRAYVGSMSIRAHLERHPCDGALARLGLLEVSQS